MAALSKGEILEALQELARELRNLREHPLELLVVGGAAMVLLYDARDSTKDVGAVALGLGDDSDLEQAAARTAAKLDLPPNWLNDGAKGYLHGIEPGETVFHDPHLRVRAAATHQLLAMKLLHGGTILTSTTRGCSSPSLRAAGSMFGLCSNPSLYLGGN